MGPMSKTKTKVGSKYQHHIPTHGLTLESSRQKLLKTSMGFSKNSLKQKQQDGVIPNLEEMKQLEGKRIMPSDNKSRVETNAINSPANASIQQKIQEKNRYSIGKAAHVEKKSFVNRH